MSYAVRIVDAGMADPRTLKAHPLNVWSHPEKQQVATRGSLELLGFVDSIVVNRPTLTILNGHLRVALAVEQGVELVPVSWVDVTPAEELLILATFDRMGQLAQEDHHQALALIDEARGLELPDSAGSLTGLLNEWEREAGRLAALEDAAEAAKQAAKERIQIRVGPLRLEVPKVDYTRWRDALMVEIDSADPEDVKHALLARLGLLGTGDGSTTHD